MSCFHPVTIALTYASTVAGAIAIGALLLVRMAYRPDYLRRLTPRQARLDLLAVATLVIPVAWPLWLALALRVGWPTLAVRARALLIKAVDKPCLSTHTYRSHPNQPRYTRDCFHRRFHPGDHAGGGIGTFRSWTTAQEDGRYAPILVDLPDDSPLWSRTRSTERGRCAGTGEVTLHVYAPELVGTARICPTCRGYGRVPLEDAEHGADDALTVVRGLE